MTSLGSAVTNVRGHCRPPGGEPVEQQLLVLDHPDQVGVLTQGGDLGGLVSGSRSSARASARSAEASRVLRLTRFTTTPASGMLSSFRRSTKYAASRSASRCGVATTRNVVCGDGQQLERLVRSLPETAEDRLEGGDEGLQVGQQPTAEDLVQRARDQVEAHADQSERSAGAGQQHLQEAAVQHEERCSGASRKSSAERAGGVSTTIRSQAPVSTASACSWPSFSIAMYSCVPANWDDRAT